jgi:GT2 family glycosyltransferase
VRPDPSHGCGAPSSDVLRCARPYETSRQADATRAWLVRRSGPRSLPGVGRYGSAVLPVYLVHWNAPDWCERSVESLHGSSIGVAVFVVDNGGLEGRRLDAITIGDGTNRGYAGGANLAIEHWLNGSQAFALVASHDLLVEGGTLEELVRVAHADPTLGIIGPHFAPHRFGGPMLRETGDVVETTWVSGGAMLLRRQCIESTGLLDERFGSYVEDVDLSYRARDAGWRVGVASQAPAVGLGSATSDAARTAAIETNWIFLFAKRGEWRRAAARWLMQPVHAARHPKRAGRYLRAFVDAPRKVWLLRP